MSAVPCDPSHQGEGAQGEGQQIRRHSQRLPSKTPSHGSGLLQAQGIEQLWAAWALQPMAGHRHIVAQVIGHGRCVGPVHQRQQGSGHGQLTLATAPRQAFDLVQGLASGVIALGQEGGRGHHQFHQGAGLRHDVSPVGIANRPQGTDGIAHAQIVGRAFHRLLHLHAGQVGQGFKQPLVVTLMPHARDLRVLQALRHLGQEGMPGTARIHQGQQAVQLVGVVGLNAVETLVGHFSGRHAGGHVFSQAPQVFNQHHAQGRRQGPQLTQGQIAHILVGAEKMRQQVFVERAVVVGHKGPGHAINTGQTGQWLVNQHRQVAEITPRQTVADFFELRFDEVKVVQQPFGRRTHIVASDGLSADVVVRLTQHADVVAQAGKESRGPQRGIARSVCDSQAATMLGKAPCSKNF